MRPIVQEFKNVAVLQAMDCNPLAQLGVALEDGQYPDGQPVFAKGDPGDSLFFIARGVPTGSVIPTPT